jgi:hypothetical protein
MTSRPRILSPWLLIRWIPLWLNPSTTSFRQILVYWKVCPKTRPCFCQVTNIVTHIIHSWLNVKIKWHSNITTSESQLFLRLSTRLHSARGHAWSLKLPSSPYLSGPEKYNRPSFVLSVWLVLTCNLFHDSSCSSYQLAIWISAAMCFPPFSCAPGYFWLIVRQTKSAILHWMLVYLTNN